MDLLRKVILKTLAYADIFDYPLNSKEIYRFLISDHEITPQLFKKTISEIEKKDPQIGNTGQYFFLFGRGTVVPLRLKRKNSSLQKQKSASRVASILKILPFLKMVGLTGALAMENSPQDDDIDFLLITSKNRLWLTRLLTLGIIKALGRHRGVKAKEIKDKICLNIFWEEDHLALPRGERDLFTAHEIFQVVPLWSRGKTYEKFLAANQWASRYLPNFNKNREERENPKRRFFLSFLGDFLEKVAYRFQVWYMRTRRTKEKIEPYRAFFHPREGSQWVLEKYTRRLKELKIE